MNLSDRVGRSVEKYLSDLHPQKNYQVQYESSSDNSVQVKLTASWVLMGYFWTVKTLVDEILENEESFKAELQKILEESNPSYRIYISDIISTSNQSAVFTISYYPRTELPPDMIRKIISYLPPDEIERISRLFPGQKDTSKDQYLWHMVVMNNFARYYPFLREVPINASRWSQLYHEIDLIRKSQMPLVFDNEMFRFAIINNLIELVMIMVNDPLIDPNLPDQLGTTPLELAVSLDKPIIANILLSRPRVVVNPRNLLNIVLNKNLPLIGSLIVYHTPLSPISLAFAIYGGDQRQTEELLEKVDLSEGWYEPLLAAIMASRPDIVKRLLELPQVDPSVGNNLPVSVAANRGYSEILELLLQDPRVDPGTQNNLPLLTAIDKGHYNIVRLLLEDPRVDPSFPNNRAVIAAAVWHKPQILQLLLNDPRVDPLQNFPEILDLTRKSSSTLTLDQEAVQRSRETFRILFSDPRIKEAVKQLPFVNRMSYSVMNMVS